jgi:hypothetical protein
MAAIPLSPGPTRQCFGSTSGDSPELEPTFDTLRTSAFEVPKIFANLLVIIPTFNITRAFVPSQKATIFRHGVHSSRVPIIRADEIITRLNDSQLDAKGRP